MGRAGSRNAAAAALPAPPAAAASGARPSKRRAAAGAGAPDRVELQAQSPRRQAHKRPPARAAMEDVPIYGGGDMRKTTGGTQRKANIQVWKGERMVRAHSFLACVEQICNHSRSIDVVKVGIVGQMGSGKTTLARAIAHAFHARMKQKYGTPFAVRALDRRELLSLDRTLRDLPPANYVLIFDDVSFLEASGNKRTISKVKNTLTTIRHREAKDVKFVIIYNYHYGRGLDKYLRQTEFSFYTSVGEEEMDYMTERYRRKDTMRTVQDFRRRVNSAQDTGTWTHRVGKDGSHTYKYRAPWIPILFGGGGRLRPAIGPTREWLTPRCPTCHVSERTPDEITPAAFIEAGEKDLGPGTFRTALKLIALENGIVAYTAGVVNAKRAIEEALTEKNVSLTAVLEHLGIEPWRPHWRASGSRFTAAVRAAPKPPAAGGRGKKAAGKS